MSDRNASGTRWRQGSLETERALGERGGGWLAHKGTGEFSVFFD